MRIEFTKIFRADEIRIMLFTTYFSSRLQSKHFKIKLISSVVLYRCEPWPLALREGHKMREFEDMAMRKIFVSNRDTMRDAGEHCIMRSFVTCSVQQILLL